MKAFIVALATVAASASASAHAADLTLMTSGGFTAAYKKLAPAADKATGNHTTLVMGPSMGATPQAIPARLKRGEPDDVVIMVGYALDDLIKQGRVAPSSKVDVGRGKIAMAVKAGAPKPDISTVEGLRKTLIGARSIAYSDSASGKYLATVGFKKLGVADQIKAKSRMIPATPVGEEVAAGRSEIGFQQLSEMKPVKGITIVGLIPDEVQQVTTFSAGVSTNSKHPEEARKLIAYLTSPAARGEIVASGMEPVH